MPETPEKKLCFVVGPIGAAGSDIRIHADWLLKGIIQPVFGEFPDFQVKRADEDARPGMITSQIISDLLDAELVIADLSSLNPNAFYEIGIRHMVQKPIIHMQLEGEMLPFDVLPFRTIRFGRSQIEQIEKAKGDLKSAVEAILEPGFEPENPVTMARGRLQLQKHATPEIRLLFEQVDALRSQLNNLEHNFWVSQASPGDLAIAQQGFVYDTNRQTFLGSITSPSEGIPPKRDK